MTGRDEPQLPPEPTDTWNQPLEYRNPANERADREPGADTEGSVGGNAVMGFFFFGACLAGLIGGLFSELPPRGMEGAFAILMGCIPRGGAIGINFGFRRRGFLAGALLALGLTIICPIAAILVICGGGFGK